MIGFHGAYSFRLGQVTERFSQPEVAKTLLLVQYADHEARETLGADPSTESERIPPQSQMIHTSMRGAIGWHCTTSVLFPQISNCIYMSTVFIIMPAVKARSGADVSQ